MGLSLGDIRGLLEEGEIAKRRAGPISIRRRVCIKWDHPTGRAPQVFDRDELGFESSVHVALEKIMGSVALAPMKSEYWHIR